MHKNTLSYIFFFIGTAFILAALFMMNGIEEANNLYTMIFSVMNSIIGTGLIIAGAIIYIPIIHDPKERFKTNNKKENK